MDSLTPPLLTAIREIRWSLLSGRSVKDSVDAYLGDHDDIFARKLRETWILRMQGHKIPAQRAFTNRFHKAFWDLLERGYLGQPIVDPLTGLEEDVERTANHDIESHVAALPLKGLIPLLGFQFPAFVILLLGPLLRDLQL